MVDKEFTKSYLVVQTVGNIPSLECKHQPHGVCYLAEPSSTRRLFADHADIDKDPKDETRPEFIERLDVERTDGRV